MKPRTRSRRPLSIGSNQSSNRQAAVSDCTASGFVVSLGMAWSPEVRRVTAGFVRAQHPETTPTSIPTTLDTGPDGLLENGAALRQERVLSHSTKDNGAFIQRQVSDC